MKILKFENVESRHSKCWKLRGKSLKVVKMCHSLTFHELVIPLIVAKKEREQYFGPREVIISFTSKKNTDKN